MLSRKAQWIDKQGTSKRQMSHGQIKRTADPVVIRESRKSVLIRRLQTPKNGQMERALRKYLTTPLKRYAAIEPIRAIEGQLLYHHTKPPHKM